MNEENATSLEKLTDKLATININNNNNESKNLHKIKKGKITDFAIDNVPYNVEIWSRAAKPQENF